VNSILKLSPIVDIASNIASASNSPDIDFLFNGCTERNRNDIKCIKGAYTATNH